MNAIQIMGFTALMVVCGCDRMAVGPGMNDFTIDLQNGYVLERTSGHQVEILPNSAGSIDRPHVPAKVVELAWNERFVLAKQHPLKRRSSNDTNDTYEIPETSASNFWILDTSVPVVYGPLDKSRFEEKRIALSVSSKLALKPVDFYRKSLNKQ